MTMASHGRKCARLQSRQCGNASGEALPAPRPPKRADAQVEKDRHDRGGHQERVVIGSAQVAGPDAPERRRKDDDGEKEEDARDFKPHNTANAAKGTQEAAHAASDPSRCLSGGLAGCAVLGVSWPRGRTGCRRVRYRSACSPVYAGSHALAGNATRDPQADAQKAANGVRLHSVMMVAAILAALLLEDCCGFPVARIRLPKYGR